MATRTWTLVVAILVPQANFAQTPPAMARAAGMPLGDGALAPGMLTVRVVRKDFTNNVAGHTVTVEASAGGRVSATTGADGRAEFAHLPVGTSVRAETTVDGERLSSETFAMPADSGVRVLLIAGGGLAEAAAPLPTTPEIARSEATAPTAARSADSESHGDRRNVWIVASGLVTVTLIAVGWLAGRRRRR
jgi:hypothetical protein